MVDFSVIIATYKRAEYLKECLASLVIQTYKNFETIIVDDGSTDNTPDIVCEFTSLLNIKYLKILNSGYPGKPRNIAVKKASADWLCFLDSDDKWTKDKLQTCLPFLGNYDVIYHKLKYFGDGKPFYRINIPSRQVQHPVFADLMTKGNSIALSSSLIKKNIFLKAGGFFEENASIGGLDDYDLWLKTSLLTNKFKFIPKSLGFYRIHSANMTENSFTQIEKINLVYNKYISILDNRYHKQAKIIKDYYAAIVHERMKNYKKALQLYKESLSANSFTQQIKSVLRITLVKCKQIFETVLL
jgi:glycosyltransferase involved in cell wall biosynthesis